ncbi:LysR family transcriptional regulator [Selenomonas sp. F0473]|uniref:LysR family transcriptional regulator n=1 Tax=Selenomonas sp. F0473 TaxID=999423 RepID=UPI00029EA3B8|nr:LysR family transcriptional regulator [Selenomonas sp. F0473]EKU71379.1 hypothetical protein HMPREF9161_00064 [Selenomonas sp. F0473]
MELKILITFKTIIRTGSFSKAAQRLNYTPSTITFHVAQLEEAAGVQIFEKSGRRMILTQAGEALVPYVDEVLEAARKIQNFQYDISGCHGTLTIGAPESMLCFRLPALLKRLHRHAPHVDLRLRSLSSRSVIEALHEDTVDIGFAYGVHDKDREQIDFRVFENSPAHFYTSPSVAARCPDMKTSGQTVAEVTRISMPRPGEIRALLDEYLRKKEISFTNTIELLSTQTIINLVENDMGIALLPDFSVQERVARKTLAIVPSEKIHVRSFCGTRKNKWHSPAMNLFFDILSEYKDAADAP